MEKEKGIHFAIRAVADLTEAERGSVVLNIVGEGTYLDTLKQLSDDLGVNDVVVFHGRCDNETLSDIYNSSRIHLMPTTRQEGLTIDDT